MSEEMAGLARIRLKVRGTLPIVAPSPTRIVQKWAGGPWRVRLCPYRQAEDEPGDRAAACEDRRQEATST